ncbi:hypothetical protein [Natronorubrum halophilum]|uniref:hypothetical protein n=1 Tax=Natronorubrum halophilum TaxID=1702106 RepID=UPI0010C2256E|nr:hypothetical protein [Natronorubrum halophilum]
MSEELYRCVCHTCELERLIEGLEDAQDCFNEHADRSHEIELLNQQTRHCYPDSTANDNEPMMRDDPPSEE